MGDTKRPHLENEAKAKVARHLPNRDFLLGLLADYHRFLRRLRHGVGACGALWLLLDRHSSHCSPNSLRLAEKLGICLLWLPRQHPKLNPVDHLWRGLKNDLTANRQFASVEELASRAKSWVGALTPHPNLTQTRPAIAKLLAQEITQDTLAFYLASDSANSVPANQPYFADLRAPPVATETCLP